MKRVSRLKATWILAKRDLVSTFYGVGIYVTIVIMLAVASVRLRAYLSGVEEVKVLLSSSPMVVPFFSAVVVCAIYLALVSVTTIAREKDQRTLMVLFFGPVDHTTYVMGKYLKGMLGYLIAAVLLVLYFFLASNLTNLGISSEIFQVLVLSIFFVSCVVSFSIFVSTLTTRILTSILLFLGIMAVLFGISISSNILLNLKADVLSTPLKSLADAISLLNRVVRWFSPFSYFNDGLDAISLGSLGKYLLSLAYSLVYSAVFLPLAIFTLKEKGVVGE
ncbi:MAG: ABC transporter permease [bacterium]